MHFWIPFTRTGSSFFPLPVKNSPGVHTTFFNACASFRLSENPLLWLFEQPYQNQKPETYLQTTGWTTFPAQVCRSVHGRTSESSMGFRYQYLPHMWLPKHEACGKDSCKTLLKLYFFFQAFLGKVCGACPELFLHLTIAVLFLIFPPKNSFEGTVRKNNPHTVTG